MGGVIPVESGDLEHLSAAIADVLGRGGLVGIFPEGGVGPTEGRLQGLRHGIAHFCLRNHAPVVAAGLAGTSELWRGKEIRLRVGETVSPDVSGVSEVPPGTSREAFLDFLLFDRAFFFFNDSNLFSTLTIRSAVASPSRERI